MLLIIRRKKLSEKDIDLDRIKELNHRKKVERNTLKKEIEEHITKEKTVTKVIAEVREKMCDGYCKFPQAYTPDEWEEVAEEVCAGCPLDRL